MSPLLCFLASGEVTAQDGGKRVGVFDGMTFVLVGFNKKSNKALVDMVTRAGGEKLVWGWEGGR